MKKSYANTVRDLFREYPGMTYRDWLDHLKELGENQKLRNQLSCALSDMRRRGEVAPWDNGVVDTIERPVDPGNINYPSGIDGFKKLFDKTERFRKSIQHCIDTQLLQRQWLKDDDMRQICGISVRDWPACRRQYEHLHLTPNDTLLKMAICKLCLGSVTINQA